MDPTAAALREQIDALAAARTRAEAEARRLAAEGYDTLGLCTDIGAIRSQLAQGVASLRGAPA